MAAHEQDGQGVVVLDDLASGWFGRDPEAFPLPTRGLAALLVDQAP